jgi:HD-like signal output (HDOD) protein
MKAERESFGFSFADVGGALARHWNFPEDFAAAIERSAEPLAYATADALHGIVHVAAWVSRAEEAQLDQAQRAEDFPQAVADKINLPTLHDTVAAMPPLADLSAGLGDMIRS